MSRLTLEHLQHINKGGYLKPVLKERDAFHVAGFMTLVKEKDDKQVISQLWDFLAQELEVLENLLGHPNSSTNMTTICNS